MVGTRTGYAGGVAAHPGYHELADHRETVEVSFDPRVTSYAKLLEAFWTSGPTNIPPGPSRTRLAIFPQGKKQQQLAEQSLAKIRLEQGDTFVDLLPGATFWPAEKMHQKFDLQRRHPKLTAELAKRYPGVDQFLASPAAARLNSCLGPFATDRAFGEAAAELGIEPAALKERLMLEEVVPKPKETP